MLAEQILQWVSPFESVISPSTLNTHRNQRMLQSEEDLEDTLPTHETPVMQTGEVITQEEMEALWTDLQQIVKPSWLTSVPCPIRQFRWSRKAEG